MKPIPIHLRQINQRRMSAFFLLPSPDRSEAGSREQLLLERFPVREDRPRSLREMFEDAEYESEDDGA